MKAPDPKKFISSNFASGKSKLSWCLLKAAFKKCPTDNKWCFYRKILYLDENKVVMGFGKSWIPLTLIGFRIFMTCVNPFNPRPLGYVLDKVYEENNFEFDIAQEKSEKLISPYKSSIEHVISYKRQIKHKQNKIQVYVEEDFFAKD